MQRFIELEGEYVTISRLLDHIWTHPLSDGRRIPLLVWGARGTGKTQMIKQYARERGKESVTYHPAHDVSGADIVGEAYYDVESRRTMRAVPEFLPREGRGDGVLFVDELNRAPDLVLAGLMELFGEGTISQSGWILPHNWLLVAAANPSELGYKVTELDDAMVDRVLHYAPGWDAPAWAKWASEQGKFKDEVLDFVLGNLGLMETGEHMLPLEIRGKLVATPRSWEYFNALYEPDLSEGLLRVIAVGILGEEAGLAFADRHLGGESPLRFPQLDRGGYEDILQGWIEREREDLMAATTRHLVSALIGRPVETKMAQRLGKYLALLPSGAREEAFAVLARSAPDWVEPLRETSAQWRTHLAKSGKLLSRSRHP